MAWPLDAQLKLRQMHDLLKHCWPAGLKTMRSTDYVRPATMSCCLHFKGMDPEEAKKLLGVDDLPRMVLGIDVQPSTAPAKLQLLRNGEAIASEVWFFAFNRIAKKFPEGGKLCR